MTAILIFLPFLWTETRAETQVTTFGILRPLQVYNFADTLKPSCVLDVLWGQPIKLIQVASNSELHENQWNDLLFFEIVPSHCFGASGASKIDCLKD